MLEMFRGENAAGNGCLALFGKKVDNNPGKVRELKPKYGE